MILENFKKIKDVIIKNLKDHLTKFRLNTQILKSNGNVVVSRIEKVETNQREEKLKKYLKNLTLKKMKNI